MTPLWNACTFLPSVRVCTHTLSGRAGPSAEVTRKTRSDAGEPRVGPTMPSAACASSAPRPDDGDVHDATRHFVAGCAAGVAACIVGHPFDTLKLFQQTARSGAATGLRANLAALRARGGVWQGIGPALVVQVLTSGFLFTTQTRITDAIEACDLWDSWLPSALQPWLAPPHGSPGSGVIDERYRLQQAMSVSSVATASVGGFITGGLLSPLVSPLEGMKCRAQVATMRPQSTKPLAPIPTPTPTAAATAAASTAARRATATATAVATPRATPRATLTAPSATPKASPAAATAASLKTTLNLGSLSWGYSASVLRCSFGNAAFFGVYALSQEAEISPAVGGGLAGACFWIAGMPFDVVKSRMQTAQTAPRLTEVAAEVVRQKGLRGLYTGLPITLLRAVPMNAACLVVYELVLKTKWGDGDS